MNIFYLPKKTGYNNISITYEYLVYCTIQTFQKSNYLFNAKSTHILPICQCFRNSLSFFLGGGTLRFYISKETTTKAKIMAGYAISCCIK
ncbi:hypothetical protein QTP88_007456 [Uroleucon formosanum]